MKGRGGGLFLTALCEMLGKHPQSLARLPDMTAISPVLPLNIEIWRQETHARDRRFFFFKWNAKYHLNNFILIIPINAIILGSIMCIIKGKLIISLFKEGNVFMF